tara:strand:- start:416 stop:598 length:183 start_codon:yes stop_codon:yes gene_type:complete
MEDNPALIAAVVLLAIVCVASACTVLRLLVPDPRQRARMRAERIERLFRDEAPGEMADAV